MVWLSVACVALAGIAFAAEPKEIDVQGIYEGSWKDAKGEGKLEVRVVAMGKKACKVFVREGIGEKSAAKLEMDGTTAGGDVSFAGKAGDVIWDGKYDAGAIAGKFGEGGTFEVKRVQRKPPTLGAPPPEGAIVLLDGKQLGEGKSPAEMVRGGGAPWYLADMSKDGWPVWEVPIRFALVAKEPPVWPTPENPLPKDWVLGKERKQTDRVIGIGEDGSIPVPGGGMNSKRQFEGSFKLHVEFLSPFMPEARGQGRGNSGVFLPDGQEIQVLDSFGQQTYTGGGCGGLYNWRDPDCMAEMEYLKGAKESKFTLASLPPGEWQTYDVEYRVEKKDGKFVGKPRVTVFHNGIKIHDNVELKADAKKGSFQFQDHGNPVRYRNIWVQPLD
jgi:hypothetical protein